MALDGQAAADIMEREREEGLVGVCKILKNFLLHIIIHARLEYEIDAQFYLMSLVLTDVWCIQGKK